MSVADGWVLAFARMTVRVRGDDGKWCKREKNNPVIPAEAGTHA